MKLSHIVESAHSYYLDDPNWSSDVGEHVGSDGAGCLLVCQNRILLLKRSKSVTEPNTWGIPGGARPHHKLTGRPMPAWSSAIKETREELGGVPPGFERYKKVLTYRGDGFKYDTFVVELPPTAREWKPHLNWESTAYGWFDQEETNKLQLHFGVAWVLKNFNPFDDLEKAR